MPAFQAINIEPEENVDDQIDTTKELHVDEALKRFQHALKLHAQGPQSREAAETAYDELFKSEIFKYREARTDYERAERHINGEPDSVALEAYSGGLDVAAGGADGVAANLALALYLSWKNHGQFFLDKLKDVITADPEYKDQHKKLARDENAIKILDNWTAALDQDPSDPEVWRNFSRFAAALGSRRIKRYCLEAAVELDDDPAVVDIEPPSLAEGLAGQQLKDQLDVLGDEAALSHPSVRPWIDREMPLFVRQLLDPIPFLPDPTSVLTPPPSSPGSATDTGDKKEDHAQGDVPEINSWADLGRELMNSLEQTERALAACEAIIAQPVSTEKKDDPITTTEKASETDRKTAETVKSTTTAADTAKPGAANAKADASAKTPTTLTRKRSQSTAGLADGGDEENGVEKRSKRVRRRDTTHAEELPDPGKAIADQLVPFQEADQHLFKMTKNLLESIGVEDTKTLDRLQEILDISGVEDRTSKVTQLAAQDIRTAVLKFDPDTASGLINKNEQPTLGLSSFLEHAKTGSDEKSNTSNFDDGEGLQAFADKIQACRGWMTSTDIAFEWVRTLSAGYAHDKWSDQVKIAVVQMLNRLDATLYERIASHLEEHATDSERLLELENLIPMLFELYVDIYERITNPSSVVDYATRVETKHRLARWLDMNSAYLRLLGRPESDPLSIRFMWASVLASSLSDKPVREHILLMWTSLRDLMLEVEAEAISLPNNVVMPKISAAAADREISKLTTMDFFLGLFQEEMQDPVHVIDTLEPVLNPTSVHFSKQTPTGTPKSEASGDGEDKEDNAISECAPQGLRDLWKFLENSGTELRLFLWSKLGDAYAAIGYKTKQLSCNLRSIEMVVADLDAEVYRETPEESRKILLMRMLKSLEDLLMFSLSTALNDKTAFDIIDEEHLKTSSSAVASVSVLLHVVSLCEDEVKVGQASSPVSGKDATFQQFMSKLRDMQIRAWCLQYTLMRAAIPQQEAIIAPQKELADFLSSIHWVVGLRKFCKASNKVFLKLMRLEILKFDQIENWEDYLDQVLYDLYGLKLGMGLIEVQEHDCPTETLDKRQTLQLAEKVTTLAKRLTMKDLLKSELKNTIEHMQQTVGQTKSTPQMIHNLRNYNEYLKRPINPLVLYRALEGEVLLDSVTVNTPETALANHGWFFLLGMIALTRFAGVDLNRRQTPGATDDLRIGATFLRLQLQFTPERWDAWFRLAECFDYELDEAVLWTADKINKDREELIKFQRSAIHCYTLALSHSRDKDIEQHDGDPLHDLYYKFGMRLYSSSREPFSMDPFEHPGQSRFGIDLSMSGTFKRPIHEQMTPYKVWKFAARLFRMAMKRNPSSWKNPFMLAKCYWKMHQTPVEDLDAKDRRTTISAGKVIEILELAVETAHRARRSRSSDPIMEPHYKIASVLHKMVLRKDIPGSEAAAILSKQPLGISVTDEEREKLNSAKGWEEYAVRNFAKLREKDKSNWQHRIIVRHAATVFTGESEEDKIQGAKAAFAILRESTFTKTMAMNVWKCDAERPGRHHVYTSQYTIFMVKLLDILDDRVMMEALLRRLRKKGADFYHFTDLWERCCNTYIKLLRAHHEIPSSDDVFKSMSHEEFEIFSDRIAVWAASDGPHTTAFACLKEAIELKKLNGGLMKSQAFDDFINDCYSKLFVEIASTLPGEAPSKIIGERNAAKEIAAKLEAEAASQAEGVKDNKPVSSLNSLLNPQNGEDSVAGSATPMDVDKPEAAPRARRVAGVRRPDVLRKAELAVSRSMEPKSAVPKSRVGSVSSKRGSQTPAKQGSDADSDEDGPDDQLRREVAEERDVDMQDADEEGDGKDEEEEDVGEETRIADDSADESDLSDVPDSDDDMSPGLMFPGLLRGDLDGDRSGEEADSESEGDEGEEDVEEDETAELAEEGDEEAEEEEEEGEGDDEAEEEEEEEADEVHVHTGLEEEEEVEDEEMGEEGDETLADETLADETLGDDTLAEEEAEG